MIVAFLTDSKSTNGSIGTSVTLDYVLFNPDLTFFKNEIWFSICGVKQYYKIKQIFHESFHGSDCKPDIIRRKNLCSNFDWILWVFIIQRI